MQSNRLILILIFVAILGIGIFTAVQRSEHAAMRRATMTEETITFNDSLYGLQFNYPESWGNVEIMEGNATCPEEDTYRTPDTLSVFDKEFRFSEVPLSDTESFMHVGIRVHRLVLSQLNDCGDEFLVKVGPREVKGEELSSVQLVPLGTEPFSGYYNPMASRLNTEGRMQYTLFYPDPIGEEIMVVQPYISFIPVSGSAELEEMEVTFKGDMKAYLEQGNTAQSLRLLIQDFDAMSKTLTIKG